MVRIDPHERLNKVLPGAISGSNGDCARLRATARDCARLRATARDCARLREPTSVLR